MHSCNNGLFIAGFFDAFKAQATSSYFSAFIVPHSTEMLTSTPPHLLLASNAKWGGLRLLTFCLEVPLQSFPGRRSICPERSLCPAHVESQSQPRARLVRSGFEWIVFFSCSFYLWVPLAVLVLRWGDGSPTCSLSHRIAATRLPSCLAPPPKPPQLPSPSTVAVGALHSCAAEHRGGGDDSINRPNKRLLFALEHFCEGEYVKNKNVP